MGTKSRSNWAGFCLRDCANRDIKCIDCIGFSEFKAVAVDPFESGEETPEALEQAREGWS